MGSGLPFLFTESVSAVTATKPAGLSLGTVRYEDYLGEQCKFKYIYNGGNSALNPTYIASVLSNSSGAYTATVSGTASYGAGIGVVVNATITTGTYGWVLVEGAATFENGAGSVPSKYPLIAGDNGVAVNGVGVVGTTVSTTYNMMKVIGYSVASMATDASGLGCFNF